jgi:hypothetical protein
MTTRKAWSAAALVSALGLFVQCNTHTPIGEVGPDGGAPGGASGASGFGGAAGHAGAGGFGGAAGHAGAGGFAGGEGGAGNAGTSGVACPAQSQLTDLFLAPTAVPYPNTALVTGLGVGDLNGDGVDDIMVGGQDLPRPVTGAGGAAGGAGFAGAGGNSAAAVTVFLSEKANGFAPGVPYSGLIQYFFSLADLDGDKRVDLVSSSFSGPTTRFNLGAGALGAAMSYDVPNVTRPVATADLDGDGKAEMLLAMNGAQGGLAVLSWAGGGTFTQKTYDAGFSAYQAVAGDLDGLAGTDVVLAGENGLHVLFNDGGSGRLTTPLDLGNPSTGVTLVDVDGDSKLDIVNYPPGAGVSVLINLGGGQFAVARRLPMSGQVVFGDVDGDGKADAVAMPNDDCSTLALYLNDGHGAFSAPSYVKGVTPGFFALGDVNGDKALDLVTATQTSVTVRLHRAP